MTGSTAFKEALKLAEQWKGRADDAGLLARAIIALPEEVAKLRDDVLADVERRLHDMKNLQRASAWPHVEGVARAEKMVREMRACWQQPPLAQTTTKGGEHG